ncbi:hypothetical protein ZIOFF_007136 [Zingiber officinale]|uniref:Uncharacterized protein n=1 Tax=Zingiber officinale TaxID=94328 RepID=A0A8J5I0Q1_ZINOF|nr:hypothetical protein ZIOFF_007136 [Zingiber officinale]
MNLVEMKGKSQSWLIEEQPRGAEIHKGHGVCRQHLVPLLKDLSLPKGILPLADTEEEEEPHVREDQAAAAEKSFL